MASNYYDLTRNYDVDNTTFGGIIYESDYEGHRSMTDMAARIASDMYFDKWCEKMAQQRKKRVKGV